MGSSLQTDSYGDYYIDPYSGSLSVIPGLSTYLTNKSAERAATKQASTPTPSTQPVSQQLTSSQLDKLASMPIATAPAAWNVATPFVSTNVNPHAVMRSMPQTAIPWNNIFTGWYGNQGIGNAYNLANIWGQLAPNPVPTPSK